MKHKKYCIILLILFIISLSKTYIGFDTFSLSTTISSINLAANKRIPFKRNKSISNLAKNISLFQKKIIGKKVAQQGNKKNKIVARQQKIINQFIKEKQLICDKKTSNFGLTILPSDIQLKKNGNNLPQPRFPLSVTSQGKITYFQLIITAYEDINSLELEFSNSNNQTIECFLGDYVYCNPSPFFNISKWYQDPVFPFTKKDGKFTITRKEKPLEEYSSYPIWIRFEGGLDTVMLNCKIKSKGLTENNIQTKITITKSGDKRKNLNLTVLNSYYPGWTDYYFQDSVLISKKQEEHNQFLQKYSLDPTLLYCSKETGLYPEISSNVNNVGPIVIYNFQNFKEVYIDTLEQKKILNIILKREKYLSSINQLKNSYIYLYDELHEDQNYKLVWTSKWLKSKGVKSKLITTSSYLNGKEEIDIWCVLLHNYEQLQKKFKGEMWVYICNTTPPPFPNFLIESDKKEFNQLYSFLKERPRIKGLLYYATNNWRGNLINHERTFSPISSINKEIMKERYNNKRWPEIPWISYSYKNFNGDGYLFYPNNDGEFIPSARLFLYQNLLLDLKQ